jgi:hypothetical protein
MSHTTTIEFFPPPSQAASFVMFKNPGHTTTGLSKDLLKNNEWGEGGGRKDWALFFCFLCRLKTRTGCSVCHNSSSSSHTAREIIYIMTSPLDAGHNTNISVADIVSPKMPISMEQHARTTFLFAIGQIIINPARSFAD